MTDLPPCRFFILPLRCSFSHILLAVDIAASELRLEPNAYRELYDVLIAFRAMF